MSTIDEPRTAPDAHPETRPFPLPVQAIPETDGDGPRTRLPRLDLPEDPGDPDRVVIGLSRDDVVRLVGSALSALAVGLLFTLVLGIIPIGWLPFFAFLWFVAIYSAAVFLHETGPAVIDRFWTVMLWSAGVVVVGSLGLVIGFTLVRGGNVFSEIFSSTSRESLVERFHFFTTDMRGVGPLDGLDRGGILYALVGTLEQIGIALAITVPLGLTTAVFLGEVGGRLARFVRTIVEAMTALPSVVAGLFVYAAIIVAITHETNGFAASIAITVLMLPIMIRTADVVLRLVPGNLREAGLALGAGQWATVWYVVLPTVRSGLTTAMILATAHGIGETAPVLLTSGVTQNLNFDPFHNAQTSLPLAALEFVESPQRALIARGFATAAFLLFVVLVLFAIARAIGGQDAGTLTPRQERRLASRSRAVAQRLRRRRLDSAPAQQIPTEPSPAPAPEDDQ